MKIIEMSQHENESTLITKELMSDLEQNNQLLI